MESVWRRWLRRLGVDLRQGEGPTAFLLFTVLFLILSFQISTKTIRQSFFLDELGADLLPLVYLIVALVAYPSLRLYGHLTRRLTVDRLFVVTTLWVALGLVGLWLVWDTGGAGLTMLFYVGSSIVYALLLSQFWMLANHALDARQARRLFAFIGAGGLLGAMCGGQIARLASNLRGSRDVLLVAVLLLGGVVVSMVVAGRRLAGGASLQTTLSDTAASHRWGFAALRKSRLLTAITVVLVLGTIVGQIVDLQFNWAIEQSTEGLDRRTASFGNFFTALGAIAFVFQILVTGRVLKLAGVRFALGVLPVFLAVGTVPLVASALLSPEVLLLTALGLKLGESGLRYSLDQSARELLFLPLPASERRQAKTFVDVVCQRGAKGIAALLLLPVTFQLMEPPQAGWISLILIAAWTVAIQATSGEYVRAFRTELERRTVDTEIPIDLRDVRTLELLLEALGSPDPRPVLHSLEILRRNGRGHLVPPLLLYHDDEGVRRRTLEVLAEVGRTDAADLVERRLGDTSPHVRAEAIRTLARLRGEEARHLMLPRLHEPDAAVRAAAVAFLLEHGGEAGRSRAARVLTDLLSDAAPESRLEGAKALGSVADPIGREELLRLVRDEDTAVVKEAIGSIRRRVERDGFYPLYVPTLVARLGDRRVRYEVQQALVAFGGPAVPALAHFLRDPNELRAIREALPGVLARIPTAEAAGELLGALAADTTPSGPTDPGRRRLIEAMALAGRLAATNPYAPRRLYPEVRREARAYGRDLILLRGVSGAEAPDLSGPLPVWPDGPAAADLLLRLLAEQLDTRLWCLFTLLSLAGESEDFRIIHNGLLRGEGRDRAHAHELLSHALPAEVRDDVLTILDDAPVEQRLDKIGRRFGIVRRDREGTLRHLLRTGVAGGEASTLAAAALYLVHTSRITGLEDEIDRLARSAADELVRETALWTEARCG